MKEFKVVFLDSEGNELYSKTLECYNEEEAVDYAFITTANGRNNEFNFEIYEV